MDGAGWGQEDEGGPALAVGGRLTASFSGCSDDLLVRPRRQRAAVQGAQEEPSICGGWSRGEPHFPLFISWALASLR